MKDDQEMLPMHLANKTGLTKVWFLPRIYFERRSCLESYYGACEPGAVSSHPISLHLVAILCLSSWAKRGEEREADFLFIAGTLFDETDETGQRICLPVHSLTSIMFFQQNSSLYCFKEHCIFMHTRLLCLRASRCTDVFFMMDH